MKKKIKLPPVSASPFCGDCARQSQLNRSVDEIVRRQGSGGRGHRIEPQAQSLKSKAFEAVTTALMFTALIGCAYGVMAL